MDAKTIAALPEPLAWHTTQGRDPTRAYQPETPRGELEPEDIRQALQYTSAPTNEQIGFF